MTSSSTDALLLFGAISAVVFVLVVTVEGARRPGYDPAYHTGSELELGPSGWIQRANFFLVGTGFAAVAFGIQASLHATVGAALVAVAGVSLVLAGIFAPDPVRGFPPGASSRCSRPDSVHAKVHDLTGPMLAFALFGGCVAVSSRLNGPWAVYTLATAAVGLVTTVWLMVSYRRDAANTGLVQRLFLGTYWLWMTLLSLHLSTG